MKPREDRQSAAASTWARWRRLPLAERCFTATCLGCCALPPLAVFYTRWVDVSGDTLMGRAGRYPVALALGCALLLLLLLFLLERPRTLSLGAYGAQLARRLRHAQSFHDAAPRRLTQE